VKRARSIDEFVANPLGRCYLGPTHVVWCASTTLCGSTHWGRPSERDARELVRLYEIARHPSLRRFDVYMDDAALEHVDLAALGVLSDYVKARLPEWGQRIRRQAVVTPSGAVALMLAGLVPLLGPTYPMRFFGSRAAALEWLGLDDAGHILDEVDRLVAEVRGMPEAVRELRAYLDGALGNATVGGAALALARSPRSLQRELQRACTSFAAELTRARVRRACALLEHSDEKVESIARRVGCLTSSRLSALFRRELGETPLAYRARHRPG
jgi:AraC-like DNA-binding protein